MIDLHTHTINSDGSLTTLELLKEAESKGLKYLSITDHNTLKSYEELNKIKNVYSGKIINGVEMTTSYKGEIIEILAYKFDLDTMRKLMLEEKVIVEKRYQKRFKLMKNRYKELGIKFDYSLFDEDEEIHIKDIHHELVKHPENDHFFLDTKNKKTRTLFFRNELYNPKSKLYVDQTNHYPDLTTILSIIHRAGGLAFLAHPYIYSKNIILELENIINNYQIDGIECYYTTFTEEQTAYLLKITSKYNLFISGGSDYHGKNKGNHFLGKVNNGKKVPIEKVESWLDL